MLDSKRISYLKGGVGARASAIGVDVIKCMEESRKRLSHTLKMWSQDVSKGKQWFWCVFTRLEVEFISHTGNQYGSILLGQSCSLIGRQLEQAPWGWEDPRTRGPWWLQREQSKKEGALHQRCCNLEIVDHGEINKISLFIMYIGDWRSLDTAGNCVYDTSLWL